MVVQTLTIDRTGHLTLPQQILDVLGWRHETEVIVELTDVGVVLKPKHAITPITARIAAMVLPVADWPQMEQEIDAGRL